MGNELNQSINTETSQALFKRVADILNSARSNTLRSVNTQMVTAYWLIGREIVQALQAGEDRAAYGKQIIQQLSDALKAQFGRGYSTSTLWSFRQFYQCFSERIQITSVVNAPESEQPGSQKEILRPTGGEFNLHFDPSLSWSHYRALTRVKDLVARDFYEKEAVECGWNKEQLERQIHSSYYERIRQHHGTQDLFTVARQRLPGDDAKPTNILKSPYVLEFLNLPDTPVLHESQLEQSIIDNLQSFLLELGKGFSFVARQKHIRFEGDDFYVDLVFYNFMLKCFLLIDLKIGKLTHRDVGQMDGYVRLYEDKFKVPGDNPTIGLILCSDKSEAVAKYSVLSEGKQIFASKYLQFLPTEEQLKIEIEKERRLIERQLQEKSLTQKGE
jgi:predicted nuclease of restriction endonuclease-like (RecB) superfamily